MKLETDRLTLRPLTLADATERYFSWFSDTEVMRNLITRPSSLEDLRAFVKTKVAQKDCLFLGVFEKDSGTHVGNIKFEPIDPQAGASNFGLLFSPDSTGKGYAREACVAAFAHVFEKLGLHTVELSVFGYNDSAIALYKKLGFAQTGTRHHQVGDENRLVIDMELERENFKR